MERVIATRKTDPDLRLGWSARLSLTTRILVVNIFALVLLAGSLFYLDNYRSRLTEERLGKARDQAIVLREILQATDEPRRTELVGRFGKRLEARIRLYDADGHLVTDSFEVAEPGYDLVDPDTQHFRKDLARGLDRFVEFAVDAPIIDYYVEPKVDRVAAWPELQRAIEYDQVISHARWAPDRTPMLSAAIPLDTNGDKQQSAMLITENVRDITSIVRAERFGVVMVLATVVILSVLLSLFLARTIVQPIRRLAKAAVRVRLGRAPDVSIPRMPQRRDEIGQLARALSDMSLALRQRIESTEAFAADVSHEIKNPLASLRSALEGLERVQDPELQKQLIAVAGDDVRRIDRLITDISDASRMDAELSRSRFERIDLGQMIEQLLAAREERDANRGIEIAFARPERGWACVSGDGSRLERVFENLLDNAVSFSPPDGLIEITANCDAHDVIVRVSDQGPGIAPVHREEVFRRFHSDRPSVESFGKHSGLGLAIARTIVVGHDGSIIARDRPSGEGGACFEVRLPRDMETE